MCLSRRSRVASPSADWSIQKETRLSDSPSVRGGGGGGGIGLVCVGSGGGRVRGWLDVERKKGMRLQNTFISRKSSYSRGFEGFPIAHFFVLMVPDITGDERGNYSLSFRQHGISWTPYGSPSELVREYGSYPTTQCVFLAFLSMYSFTCAPLF
ncbi:hypothetical protein E2C01_053812 [Portunus trituberculatus]|uniref:Uncharacterized protein n=1 Tax=Portunus trituberculatus TaxID=210409 RepID=A0A5B7GT99_PORTR|nr:hypothetical protein [Portunus trituberculatus]